MIDFLSMVCKQIAKNELISQKCGGRIKMYEYPHYEEETKPFIIVRPLIASSPSIYGNDEALREQQIIQIDVQSMKRSDCALIMDEIEKELGQLNFRQSYGDSLDEYLSGVRRFVIAKRFECISKI